MPFFTIASSINELDLQQTSQKMCIQSQTFVFKLVIRIFCSVLILFAIMRELPSITSMKVPYSLDEKWDNILDSYILYSSHFI